MADQDATLARVAYRGGSADGIVIESTPEPFHTHPQRELYGADPVAPFELYRNRGEQTVMLETPADDGVPGSRQVQAVVFEFDGAATQRRLDDDMNPLEGTPTS